MLSNQNKKIVINYQGGRRVVSIFDILYVEVNKHVLIYHLKKENVTASGTLKKVFEEIGDDSFALCNQCYLVNLRYVTKIDDGIAYLGKIGLVISRAKKKAFIEQLNNYLSLGGGL